MIGWAIWLRLYPYSYQRKEGGAILSLSELISKFIEPMIGMDTEERKDNIFTVWNILGEARFFAFS
jgi:hypothetical protein